MRMERGWSHAGIHAGKPTESIESWIIDSNLQENSEERGWVVS